MIVLTTPQREALLALADLHQGRVTPEMVVEAARDPSSPLHSAFTWDDAQAAHEHRLTQARVLLRRVRVEIETGTRLIRVPYFTRDPEAAPQEQGYVSLARLRAQEDLSRAALVAAFGRAARALEDARSLGEALGLREEVEALRRDVLRLRDEAARYAAE
jgi:hypothetical protein